MLKRSDMHDYQNTAVDFIKQRRKCALFLDMGLGKTVSSLTAASDFLDDVLVTKVLVIAPLRVANTVWEQETHKWEHLSHLKAVICTGTQAERLAALSSDADIFIINRENVQWLIENVKWDFDMAIVDESSSFKNHASKRFKYLKKVLKHIKSIVLLTGTPSPQGYIDLWSQLFLIDSGERLGRNITTYRHRFFSQDPYGYTWELNEGSDKVIQSLISDVCTTMFAADHLKMPGKINITEYIEFDAKSKKQYDELEKEFLLTLAQGTDIEAPSAGVLANKLLQICNGAIYDADKNYHAIHDLKIKALKEIIEDNANENMLIAYNFKSDLERLQKAFPYAKVLSKSGDELKAWNEGKVKMLLAHPASAGHGLNAQFGGSMLVWFGLNWSLELYEQFNARLYRQGQMNTVRVIHIVAKSGIDEKVMLALTSKAKTQKELMTYLIRKI